ncbi:MAG: bifunctional oligoribonuclease/PAP phosphatase NrnA [Cyclobacteriaceae bacterium]
MIHPSAINTIEPLKPIITGKRLDILITAHTKPDADALGSCLALKGYLEQYNHRITVMVPSDYPDFINWMEGNDEVIVYSKQKTGVTNKIIRKADFIFCLDFSALSRIDRMEEPVRNSKAKKVLIDHHLEPEDFADYTLWSDKAAATAELIYELIQLMGDLDKITPAMADCMYAGIMTDTGSFRHSNTTENIHRVVADLIVKGANNAKIHQAVYDNNSITRIKLLGYVLNNKLTVLPERELAYVTLSDEELKRFDSKNGDTEGFVNYALSITGINYACIIIEREDMVKLSFRSVGDRQVNQFAKKNFEGGGHKNAAGGKSDLSLADTEKKLVRLLDELSPLKS